MNPKHKRQSQTKVYQGRILDVIHQEVLFSSGESIEYEIVHRPSIAVVIPLTSSGHIILTLQYRASIDKYVWEFPGGTVEEGETPIDTARRELEEEVGYRAHEIKLMHEFFTSPHFSDEKVYLYLATNLSLGQINPQEKEFISAHVLTDSEIEDKYLSGEIFDAKTIVAYQFFIQTRKNTKK